MVPEIGLLVLALTFGDGALQRVQAQRADGADGGVGMPACDALAPDAAPRDVVEAFARTLPVGSRVKFRLMDTQSLKGILLGVDREGLIIRPMARQPQRAFTYAPSAIFSLEALESGAGVRKPYVRRKKAQTHTE